MLVFVSLFQSPSKGNGEYKLLVIFIPFGKEKGKVKKGAVREPMV